MKDGSGFKVFVLDHRDAAEALATRRLPVRSRGRRAPTRPRVEAAAAEPKSVEGVRSRDAARRA